MRNSRKGQSLVETTLVLAAFMGLLLGMVAVSQMLFVQQTLADRAHQAARWGAVNAYNAEAIRNVVLYGTPQPDADAAAFAGLSASAIEVANPGCPGPACRVSIRIAGRGVRSVEMMEPAPTGGAPAKP